MHSRTKYVLFEKPHCICIVVVVRWSDSNGVICDGVSSVQYIHVFLI